jgi:hypothetical protein
MSGFAVLPGSIFNIAHQLEVQRRFVGFVLGALGEVNCLKGLFLLRLPDIGSNRPWIELDIRELSPVLNRK